MVWGCAIHRKLGVRSAGMDGKEERRRGGEGEISD